MPFIFPISSNTFSTLRVIGLLPSSREETNTYRSAKLWPKNMNLSRKPRFPADYSRASANCDMGFPPHKTANRVDESMRSPKGEFRDTLSQARSGPIRNRIIPHRFGLDFLI